MLIVGPYPPPHGGVSAHVERLSAALADRGLRVAVLDHFAGGGPNPPVVGALHRNPVRYWLALHTRTAPVVHYHHARLSTLVATALTRSRHARSVYVVTVHGRGIERHLTRRIAGGLARWALRRFDVVIAVSAEIGRSLELNVGRQVSVVPAYLPRRAEAAAADGLHEFLEGGRTLVAAAYRVVPRRDTGDDYGLDVAVTCFRRLAASRPELRLAIFLAHPPRGRRAKRYLSSILRPIEREGLRERFSLYTGADLTPVWDHEVVYLRPSRTDGDAVSVREALDASRPVLASDVVARPEGVELVSGHSAERWCDAIDGSLDRVSTIAHADPARFANALFDLYARYLPAREHAAQHTPA